MVLESLISPLKAERDPWKMFFIGLLYSTFGLFLSLFLFEGPATSLILVFLTTLSCTILMFNTLKLESDFDREAPNETARIRHHSKALLFLVFLFVGFVVSFAFWYLFLPPDVTSTAFHAQIESIEKINSVVFDNGVTGHAVGFEHFGRILLNNLKVLVFSLLFSFFFGLGAIFILTWNASVVGTATGLVVTQWTKSIIVEQGGISVFQYALAFGSGILRFMIHGTFEMAAYFVGGLAGGLISIAVINKSYTDDLFSKVIKDALYLVCASIMLLVVAAMVEVYVTPFLFS